MRWSPAADRGSARRRRECLPPNGARVSLLGRRRALEGIAGEIGASAFACDVTDRAAMAAAFDAARAANGPFDFVILNAGIADSAPFARTTRDTFDAIVATNLTAVFDGAQLALPDLLPGEDKRLIVVASVAGLKGGAYAAPYVASKHGAVGWSGASRSNSPRPTSPSTPSARRSSTRRWSTTAPRGSAVSPGAATINRAPRSPR